MAYYVIKKIGGKSYLYRQQSIRQGSKVITESNYICPYDSSKHGSNKDFKLNKEKIETSVRDQLKELNYTKEDPKENKVIEPQAKEKLTNTTNSKEDRREIALNIKIDTKKKKISETTLNRQLKNTVNYLESLGVDTSSFPKISIQYESGKSSFRKSWFGLGQEYIVSVPKYDKNTATGLKKAYNKCLASISLQMLKKQKPKVYQQIKNSFSKERRNTRNYLIDFVLSTSNKSKLACAFMILVGQNNSVLALNKKKKYKSKHKQKKFNLSDENLGLEDKNNTSWKDDFISLMGEINQKGFSDVFNTKKVNLRKAIKKEKLKIEEYKQTFPLTRKRTFARKAYKREIAKVQLQKAILRKLWKINNIFNFVDSKEIK